MIRTCGMAKPFTIDVHVAFFLLTSVTLLQVGNIMKGMDAGLLITGVPLVVLSRAVNIYPLAYLVNKGGQANGLFHSSFLLCQVAKTDGLLEC